MYILPDSNVYYQTIPPRKKPITTATFLAYLEWHDFKHAGHHEVTHDRLFKRGDDVIMISPNKTTLIRLNIAKQAQAFYSYASAIEWLSERL